MLALICGDSLHLEAERQGAADGDRDDERVRPVLEREGLGALCSLVIGGHEAVGQHLVADKRVPLLSFTGSTEVGRDVAAKLATRYARAILECGGNNAIVLMDDADLELALPAILFGAVGTAGQRCTTTRRLIVHEKIADEVEKRLVKAYAGIKIGDPSKKDTLCGPLIDAGAIEGMEQALAAAKKAGGKLLCGGKRVKLPGKLGGGNFIEPAIVRARNEWECVQEETFAPLLWVIRVKDIDEAIAAHNGVPQGLSSAIFTLNMRHAEKFLSAVGSDCGIANVNIGTSGAEIGGAFGGEKETGGGRESGSDSWKSYMRRQTNTVNWSTELPLAQGIVFG